MGKKSRKPSAFKNPHANSKEEVIKMAKERSAANQPPLTEAEKLTISEAEKILAEKESILAEARSQRGMLEANVEQLQADLNRINTEIEEKKETLRLNDDAQKIIDNAEETQRQADAKAQRIREEAKKEADAEAQLIISKAEKEAERIKGEANTKAKDIEDGASTAAESILSAARAEEKKVIEGKEAAAQLVADSIMKRADEYAVQTRKSADEYELDVRRKAGEAAHQIVSIAQEKINARKKGLDQRASSLDERESDLIKLEAEIPAKAEEAAQKRTEEMKAVLQQEIEEYGKKAGVLDQREQEITRQKNQLDGMRTEFDQAVNRRVAEEYVNLNNQLETARNTANDLTAINRKQHKTINELKVKIHEMQSREDGDLQQQLALKDQEIVELRRELQPFRENGLTAAKVQEYVGLSQKCKELQELYDELLADQENLRHQAAINLGAASDLDQANRRLESMKEQNAELLAELDSRKRVSRADMVRPIQEPPADMGKATPERDPEAYVKDELAWLEHIEKKSKESGIIFAKRQLFAYHTSLKIADWSPMVVLSGVSGTGKSELPRQYALHGGLKFLSLPVKPDWDSPSSLFGFYNAIENRFEATELVRYLYQMQGSVKSAWSDDMLLVLLDEMNLAHPEQYFADLLSKFEESRNSDDPAYYELQLGAGERPERLEIGRNVLWTGTMNEDETTKGLSDKVVDRSMQITFPCPKELYNRTSGKLASPEMVLSKGQWELWKGAALTGHEDSVADILDEKRGVLQDINSSMSAMGRNIGHRVWQSIQNYILNYPDVISANKKKNTDELQGAMQIAFCDALAFKLMPKLRGLEVRGRNEERLDKIRQILSGSASELVPDFDLAREKTSDVFQWSSAKFMGL